MTASQSNGLGQVCDWMSRNPVTVSLACPVAQVVRVMVAQGIRHVLVMDGERLDGIVSNRDLRSLLIDAEPHVFPSSPVSRVMTESPVTVSPDASLTDAARAMLEGKIGALPVVEGGRPVGILTRSDALEALLAWVEAGGAPRRGPIASRADRPESAPD